MANVIREATFENPRFNVFPNKLVTDNLIQRGYMRLLAENLMVGDENFDTTGGTVKAALSLIHI